MTAVRIANALPKRYLMVAEAAEECEDAPNGRAELFDNARIICSLAVCFLTPSNLCQGV